jgi:integrase
MTRGTITKRARNSWQIKDDLPRDHGVRHQRYKTVRGSFKDAQRELTRLLNSVDGGTHVDYTRMTVADYLCSWFDGAHAQSPKTLERYAELNRSQITPHLGQIGLQKLHPEHLQRWHRELIKSGLASRTVTNAHKLLHRVLADAVKNGTLARNVAEVRRPPRIEATETKILTPEQITDVLTKLEHHRLLPVVSLALATGMRRGELLGLQWGDVELDAGTLRVERSLEETKAGLRFKSPKTRRGRRNISLPPDAVTMLRAYKVKQLELRLVLGLGKIEPSTLVFSDVEGEPFKPHTVSRAWQRVVVAKGLPRVSFHALRHTHASMLIRAGVDILTISRRLGHSAAAITLDVYGHLIEGADAAAARALEGLLK